MLDLHEQFHKYFSAENVLEFFARRGADFFDGFSAGADQNSLLAVALHVNGGANAQNLGSFFEAIHQDGDGVRDFVARGEDRLFADDFGGQETLGLVGVLISGKHRRGFG